MLKRFIWLALLAGLLLYFIPKLLFQFSIFLSPKGEDVDTEEEGVTMLFPPILDGLPTATNSAKLVVKGYSQNAKSIELYINGILKETVSAEAGDGNFKVINVPLYEGENKIQAKAIDQKGTSSDFSEPSFVQYKKGSPKLTVEQPEDGAEFHSDQRKIDVVGVTDEDVSVTLNERWVRVGKDGSFRHTVTLGDGENILQLVAIDAAGNKIEVIRTVRYSP